MGKITGKEPFEELPDKVKLLYQAVGKLVEEGADISSMKVSDITDRAGIGKGTAYDYFESKEEIIALGMLYYLADKTDEMKQTLEKMGSFSERLAYLLNQIEKQMGERDCMLQFVHLLFDATQTGMLLRNIIRQCAPAEYPPILLIHIVIARGIEEGELKRELTEAYMMYTLLARLVAYMAYLNNPVKEACSGEQFRRQMEEGIMREFCV